MVSLEGNKQPSAVRVRTVSCLAGVALAVWSVPAVWGQDMASETEEQVRRTTVMVLMEMPGRSGGSSGTGGFINSNGLVITNNHVVDPNHGKSREERARNFNRITLPKYHVVVDSGTERERRWPATLLHQSESGDMALLQVHDEKGEHLSTPGYLRFIPEVAPAENQKIWIFGFPGGRSRSADVAITAGLVTKLLTTSSGAVTYVETDATAHPGNSGGPAVDITGRLVGVVTHKRFGRGEKDRSGAVPAGLAQRFILSGFEEGRLPEQADLLPFVTIFTDPNGMVEFPTYPRAVDEAVIHWRDGNVRRGRLKDERIRAVTALGNFEVPLAGAAYLLVNGKQATLVMDGGDRLAFPARRLSVAIEFGTKREKVGLEDIEVVAFARPTGAVSFGAGEGLVLEAHGCRLGLSQVEGRVSVGGSRFALSDIVSIESSKPGREKTVRTAKGERVRGLLGRQAVRARCVWSSEPISITLGSIERATVQPVEWALVNARGRRLVDRLDIQGEELARIAVLLDGPDWQRATPPLGQAENVKRRSRESKRQLKLLGAVHQLRGGDLAGAAAEFEKLGRKADQVAGVARCYASVLKEHPDGTFAGASLCEPDTVWRASSARARRALADVDERLARLDKLDYRKKAKELKRLERAIDTANRLEIGIAQSKLMQLLEKAYFDHLEGHEEMRLEYNRTVQEHNRQRNRTQQQKHVRRLKAMEGRLTKTAEEIERIYARLQEEAVGFVVEPPKLD